MQYKLNIWRVRFSFVRITSSRSYFILFCDKFIQYNSNVCIASNADVSSCSCDTFKWIDCIYHASFSLETQTHSRDSCSSPTHRFPLRNGSHTHRKAMVWDEENPFACIAHYYTYVKRDTNFFMKKVDEPSLKAQLHSQQSPHAIQLSSEFTFQAIYSIAAHRRRLWWLLSIFIIHAWR